MYWVNISCDAFKLLDKTNINLYRYSTSYFSLFSNSLMELNILFPAQSSTHQPKLLFPNIYLLSRCHVHCKRCLLEMLPGRRAQSRRNWNESIIIKGHNINNPFLTTLLQCTSFNHSLLLLILHFVYRQSWIALFAWFNLIVDVIIIYIILR